MKEDIDSRKKKKGEEAEETPKYTFKQRDTEEEILAKKRKISDPQSSDSPSKSDSKKQRKGEDGKEKKKPRRERTKKANYRPDADHSFGALSLASNKGLMQKLFGGT